MGNLPDHESRSEVATGKKSKSKWIRGQRLPSNVWYLSGDFCDTQDILHSLVGLVLLFMVVFLTRHKPEHADEFTPVAASTIRFLSVSADGSFKPSTGVPLVESALGKSFYEQNFDAVYNKITMRCRFQIVSGPSVQLTLDDYRVLLVTSKEKVLLSLHPLNETIVSDEFICVRDESILSIPGCPGTAQ